MAEILYQGHGSLRFTTDGGYVVYVDPFAGDGYDVPADAILITHEHGDHNAVGIVAKKPECRIVRASDMLTDGEYMSKEILPGVEAVAVPAENRNHPRNKCVGYIVSFDGKRAYFAGDTSTTEYMKEMKALKLDYAFLPTDGVYNMSAEEASECAAMIGAANTIPIHTKPGELFDVKVADRFKADGKMILKPGETIKW